tara:strand:+ start:45 stop:710 length:666 start_codon:yes stop_codon:yes gene_type:complete
MKMQENILYSFRRCPYAIRARWSILNTGVKVTLREIDLKKKPKELFDLSPKGTVPVLVTNTGIIIDESIDIMLWALKKSSRVNHIKGNEEAIFDLIKENDKVFKYHLDRFKYSSRYDQSKRDLHRREAMNILYKWNKMISISNEDSKKYCLISDKESIADWALWPFVRQYKIADPIVFEEDIKLSNINNWLDFYIKNPLFKLLMKKVVPWQNADLPMEFGS